MLPVHVTCVVDFMCPWSFIALRSMQIAMKDLSEVAKSQLSLTLIPFEFDRPGTYPPEGTDWTEYCLGYGQPKAKFLLEEKLPRAFELGKIVGIEFDINRRIVHTEQVNAALMFVQEQRKDEPMAGFEFTLRMLHEHFEKLHDPNEETMLTDILTNDMLISQDEVSNFWARDNRALDNEKWTQMGRALGAPPVPFFKITCNGSEDDISYKAKETNLGGPTNPEYFRQMFILCGESAEGDAMKEL